MGLGLRRGAAPALMDLLSRDHVPHPREPGALPRQLEQEGLAAGQVDQGAAGRRRHADPLVVPVRISDDPSLVNEGMQRQGQVGLVEGSQRRGLEPAREGSARPGARRVLKLGQAGEVAQD